MKLSDLNAQIAALKASRDAIHDQLHAVLADKSQTVLDRETKEAELRDKIRVINVDLYPMEMERAEIDRMVKGQPRKQAKSHLAEEVTLA